MKLLLGITILTLVTIGLVSGDCAKGLLKCTTLMADVAKVGEDQSKACIAMKNFIGCFEDNASECTTVFEAIEPNMKKMRELYSEKCGSSAILSSVVVVFIGYFFNSFF